jgi:hypothetical protein
MIESASGESAMDRKSSGIAIRSLALIALLAATSAPAIRGGDGATVTILNQTRSDRAASAPIVLAQGRCFNGRCF